MTQLKVIVVGGGAAGFFAAITCAEALRGHGAVTLLERGPHFLQKVKISGGGRCNVTHSCFEPKELVKRYPRGERALIGAFHRFQAADTVKWFESRGVQLKTEADGRMFPTTDQSQTIIECLMKSASAAGVKLIANCGVDRVEKKAGGGIRLMLAGGEKSPSPALQAPSPPPGERDGVRGRASEIECDSLLLATGGCRAAASGSLPTSLGHTLEPPVPSLFTFHVADSMLEGLAGVSVERATVSVPQTKLKETAPLLVTHWGLSGPAILRLSAWGARELHERNYQFPLNVNWLPGENFESAVALGQRQRELTGAKRVVNAPLGGLPSRLWERLVAAAGISTPTQWAGLDRARLHALARQLTESEFAVTGKSLNKDEFVTCGGVRLAEVNFKTMESRVCPGLFFAGELLDIDGITGGFNFQAAWTTGWIAGNAMAEMLRGRQT
ncbi:MAG: NAD(P)/FAD-dependent oxidoreductase [Verrucomicrobia bacterium]|nr:NAD(P)/FAD-dependent oxidoreductase [Verrucomicrobiota bacterium]